MAELLGQHLSEVPDKNSDHEKTGNIPGEHRRSRNRGAQCSLEEHGTVISRGLRTPLNVEAKHIPQSLLAHSQLRDFLSPRGPMFSLASHSKHRLDGILEKMVRGTHYTVSRLSRIHISLKIQISHR